MSPLTPGTDRHSDAAAQDRAHEGAQRLAEGARGVARASRKAGDEHPVHPAAPDAGSAARSHFTTDGFLEDKLGFFVAECDCGWVTPPSPDEETAADFLMQHAYEQGILDERNGRVPR